VRRPGRVERGRVRPARPGRRLAAPGDRHAEGERFIFAAQLAALTGDRVRTGFRIPDEPDELPAADAVVVAPATFNTMNKWAAGITDT